MYEAGSVEVTENVDNHSFHFDERLTGFTARLLTEFLSREMGNTLEEIKQYLTGFLGITSMLFSRRGHLASPFPFSQQQGGYNRY